jgi:capsular exopolysaccharide synthesis family protein
MDIRSYIAILMRRKWIISLTAAITVAMAALVTSRMTPVYAATATVRVATAVLGRVEYGDYIYAERLMNTYVEIITSNPVEEEVKKHLGLDSLPPVWVEVVPDTELIRITAEGPDPFLARDVANALANVLQSESQAFYTGGGKSAHEILSELLAQADNELTLAQSERDAAMNDVPEDTDRLEALSRTVELKEQTFALLLLQYENVRLTEAMRANTISLVEPASRPWAPSKPRKKVNILLGAVIGLSAGLGLALVFENIDSRLYSTQEIKTAVELSVLGQIPASKRAGKKRSRVMFSTNGFSIQHEAYRRLRTNILALSSESSLRTLMITSAERGEGKSSVAANLALTFAKSGRRVLLIDSDLRLPALHKLFDLPNQVGLCDVLDQPVALEEALQNGGTAGLYVLASGPQPQNPTELLGSAPMQELIERLSQQFDVVLVDTPCLLSVTDAAVVGPLVDGVLLVVSRGQARRETVRAALGQLADVRANTIGVIVNRAEKGGKYIYGGG